MRASRASGRPYFLLTLVYICVHLTHIALSCVLLLNGWTPMTVRQRAELADISVMGVVLNTWEGMDTTQEDDTYIAEGRGRGRVEVKEGIWDGLDIQEDDTYNGGFNGGGEGWGCGNFQGLRSDYCRVTLI
ncbi:hypothetical protein RRG08_066985 [Elysia crispata]|uniref:Uncharacterized protein n=1 Tax=Elysia crispata TaxID=231223 RepID=A0AAE0Z9X1_9GAST|nr:hypothetical protein RRG08_066985 [Elysia crispata]